MALHGNLAAIPFLLLLCAVLAVPGRARAQDADVVDQLVREVVQVVADEKTGRLSELARRQDPDAWVLADELCRRGEFDVAHALATAVEDPIVADLSKYVARLRNAPVDTAIRERLAKAMTAGRTGGPSAMLAVFSELPDEVATSVPGILALWHRSSASRELRHPEDALRYGARAAESAEALGWVRFELQARGEAFRSAWRVGRNDLMLVHAERLVDVTRRISDDAEVADMQIALGIANYRLGRLPEAERVWTESMETMARLGKRPQVASILGNLANLHMTSGALERSVSANREALAIYRELGDRASVAHTQANLGHALRELDDLNAARAAYEEALPEARRQRDGRTEASCLAGLASLERSLSQYARAVEYFEQAYDVAMRHGWRTNAAGFLGDMSWDLVRLGDTARSMATLDRAVAMWNEIGNPGPLSFVHGRMAAALTMVRERDAALEHAERGVELARASGVPSRLFSALTTRAGVRQARKEFDEALADVDRAREIGEAAGVEMRNLDIVRADTLRWSGNAQRALEVYERLLAEGGDGGYSVAPGKAWTLIQLGRLDEATEFLGQAREVLSRTEERYTQVDLALIESTVHHLSGRDAEAIRSAEDALEALTALFAARTDDDAGQLRSNWGHRWATPVAAAFRAGDAAALCRFLESTQAGTLLEALGGRDRLQAVTLPPELQAREVRARAEERAALVRFRRARQRRAGLKEVRAAKKELESARAARATVVTELQRLTRGAAGLVYPEAAALDEIQGELRAGEAFVHLAPFEDSQYHAGAFVALVVTPERAEAVSLGDRDAVVASARALDELLADPASDRAAVDRHAAVLRDHLFEPLALATDVKRVLITAREFAMSALALADPTREIVYVPSGSTYVTLCEDRDKKGEGVLGLGDPEYGAKERQAVVAANRAGRLLPLPGTRVEVEAVADVKLLGEEATEENLRAALAEQERWRSIHLACHGLAPDGGGTLSSLAISVGDTDDGNLTAQEILMLDAPADLVALSACETGRGKNYAGEGVVGLPRAFMVAGASRVLCSLWKVDDQATRELMVKFYEEWKTKPAATALRNAQAHVRKQEKWSHPYFWAAWQLWGLPD